MSLKSKPSSQLVSTVEEELEKALQAVAMTKFRTEQLHENWRRHLFRMSVGMYKLKRRLLTWLYQVFLFFIKKICAFSHLFDK